MARSAWGTARGPLDPAALRAGDLSPRQAQVLVRASAGRTTLQITPTSVSADAGSKAF